jgi:hypothetical protein
MTSASIVVSLRKPETLEDPLTTILRSGARQLLAQAIEAEIETFLATMKDQRLANGRERLVRHGFGPERVIQTGIGPVAVRRVKLRDRGAAETGAARIRFTSAILPRWARRTPSLDALLSTLYLRGVSMGKRRSQPCWGMTRRTCHRRRSRGCVARGRPTTRAGSGVTCQPGGMSTFGRTGSICRRAWSLRPNACWC